MKLPHPERLVAFGFVGSALVLLAGLVALLSPLGVVIASVLLTAAAMVLVLGLGAARARPRRFDIGLLLPIAAALPLFGLFYAVGRLIFDRLGQAAGGGLLLGIGGALAVAFGLFALRGRRPARP